jgi:hypothetical protein
MSSLTEHGKLALQMRAVADANAQAPILPVTRYLDAMESNHELLPGSAKLITDKILGRVGDHPPRLPGTARELLVRAVEHLESEQGKRLLNPEFKADDSPPLKKVLQRLGMPAEQRDTFYTEKAAGYASHATAAGLVGAVYNDLLTVEHGKYLGFRERVVTKPEGYTPPRPAGAPTITESHYRRIKSSF